MAGSITSITLQDSNANGKINSIVILFSANVQFENATDDLTTSTASLLDDFTVMDGAGAVTISSMTENPAGTLTLALSEADTDLTVNTSNSTMEVSYTDPGDATVIEYAADTSDIVITTGDAGGAQVAEADGAAPAYISSAYKDITVVDGTIDRLDITFSETVTLDEWDDADWTIVGGTVVLANESAGATNAADIRLTVSATAATTGGASAPTVAYTAAGGTANSVHDAGNNNTGDIAAQNISDGAAPFILSGTFTEGADNDGKVEAVVLTVSADTGLACTAFTGATDLTVGTAGSITLAAAVGDSCADNNTSTFTITMATGGTANITGGTTAPVVTYTQPTSGLEDGAGNDVPTKAGLTLTDATAPILVSVTRNTSSSKNILTFVYSEPLTIKYDGSNEITTGNNHASHASLGNMTTAGTITGLGSFATAGSLVIPTLLNNVGVVKTATVTTLTVTLGSGTDAYIQSGTTESQVAGNFTVVESAENVVEDAVGLKVNTSQAVVAITATANWDYTRPTITDVKLYDNYLSNSLTAGGTFASGRDGRADTLVFTASETLATVTDGATTRDDWTITSTSGEYGASMTVVKASATGTTYTLVFSGANIYYSLGTLTVTYATTSHSFQNSAGVTIAPSTLTAKVCSYGYVCTGGGVNYALITSQMSAPDAGDTTAPSSPTAITAVQDGATVKLTWTDPTATDLKEVIIYRGKNGLAATKYATVLKGVGTYTDSDVAVGDVLEYLLKAVDTSYNVSKISSAVPITVTKVEEEVAAPEEETPAEEELTPEEEVPAEEVGAEEEITEEETGAEEEVEEEVPFIPVVSAPVYDVPATHWAKESIDAVRAEGWMVAKKAGKFMLEDNMTRAEAAKVIAAALGSGVLGANDVASNLPFKDVAKTQWYAPYVSYIWKLGIVSTKDAFEPGRLVNRAELFVMILKAKGVKIEAAKLTTAFADIPSGKWFDTVATVVYNEGLCTGKPRNGKNYFAGADNVTRGEAAVMFAGAFLE